MAEAEANGELTRQVLRAELQAGLATQTLAIHEHIDERLKPVNEHIARIDRGEFTEAQAAAVVRVIKREGEATWRLHGLKVPFAAVLISTLAFAANLTNWP